MKMVGIDLAGKMENPTGICVLEGFVIDLKTLYSDEEIIKTVKKNNPSLIAVDAPLSLPKSRCCLDKNCKCAMGGHFRQAERDIQSYGRVLPLTFLGMKMLTLRGIALATKLRKGYEVIETHPRTSQKILGFNDQNDLNLFFKFADGSTQHELDATLAALTGFLYLKDCYIELGDPEEGTIIIPRDERCLKWLKNPNY